MGEKIYNKLVRDRIPEIIEKAGKKYIIETVDNQENYKLLNKKLLEEVNEYLEEYNIEELADIIEVIHGILENRGITMEQLEKIRLKKREERGGFSKGIKLVKVIE